MTVRPAILRRVVNKFANFRQVRLRIVIDNRLKFAKYLDFLERMGSSSNTDSGYYNLVKQYTSIEDLSQNFLRWFYPDDQKRLMTVLGLGDGTQDHTLRKRMPVLLSEEEMASMNSLSRGKRKLKDIADELNAVNKNQTLKGAFEGDPDKKNQRTFNSIFNSDD